MTMSRVLMKALRTFRGRAGEGNEVNKVKTDTDFTVADQRRADELETAGLAVPKSGATPKREARGNLAAETGPLSTRGGKTGVALTSSSLRAARVPVKPASKKSATVKRK